MAEPSENDEHRSKKFDTANTKSKPPKFRSAAELRDHIIREHLNVSRMAVLSGEPISLTVASACQSKSSVDGYQETLRQRTIQFFNIGSSDYPSSHLQHALCTLCITLTCTPHGFIAAYTNCVVVKIPDLSNRHFLTQSDQRLETLELGPWFKQIMTRCRKVGYRTRLKFLLSMLSAILEREREVFYIGRHKWYVLSSSGVSAPNFPS
ncbi:hypothetical protein NPIL_211231 [Nephila pilipes]|uniref:Uncharacterized protein n=1 Tax=Nephila pilipes TaxID=299642 RepID=A0A8X6TVW6_NEPPI|nr:hypothetical protein NPIL_211231 [Nephila pilipes]